MLRDVHPHAGRWAVTAIPDTMWQQLLQLGLPSCIRFGTLPAAKTQEGAHNQQ